jgi:hypothetical protein
VDHQDGNVVEDWGDEHRTHRAYEAHPLPLYWLIAGVVALVGAVLLVWDK